MSLDVDRLLLYYFYHSFVNSMQISVDCASSLFGFEELWLFRPFAGSPLADSPPPLEYTCDSLLRLVFVFQFTERQQVSNRQTTTDNRSNSSTVT